MKCAKCGVYWRSDATDGWVCAMCDFRAKTEGQPVEAKLAHFRAGFGA